MHTTTSNDSANVQASSPSNAFAATNAAAEETEDRSDDDEDNELFYDANSDFSALEIDLSTALEEATLAIHYFFNNEFTKARQLLAPYAQTSMYHAMGQAVFAFLEAMLTFEQQHITIAAEELRKCQLVCAQFRRKSTITQTIGRKFRKGNYTQFSDLEAHAELCSAEALLLKALLTFVEDETLGSLLRGGMKIRQCYNSYKECAQILEQRSWTLEQSRIHFESGVRMGVGTFNLMISLLPARIIKVLEFIGFSGNKANGLRDLHNGYELQGGLRRVLCALTLLGYHLIVCYVFSHREGDLALCERILDAQLQQYRDGVWFLFFKGRLEFMKGNLNEAIHWYKKSWKSQNVWPQFHHLSFWELYWVNCLKLDWREASSYASNLLEHSNWSRTIYSYQKAAVLLMLPPDTLTPAEQQLIDQLMRQAPAHKQRIAGKSLPMEKFICKKAERYFAQQRQLCLPAIELMYVWNTYKLLATDQRLAQNILQLIEQQLAALDDAATTAHGTSTTQDHLTTTSTTTPTNGSASIATAGGSQLPTLAQFTPTGKYGHDNLALCLLLRGACLRQMCKYDDAKRDLEDCLAQQNLLKEDTYLIAYAHVELALLHADQHRYYIAIAALEEAKKKFTGYSLESRLHFRIHTALMELKERQHDQEQHEQQQQ